MVTKVKLVCEVCGKEFERRKTEADRNAELGRRVFCSLNCTGKETVKQIPLEKKSAAHLKSNNRLDEFSPFKILFKSARLHSRDKGREFNLTLGSLKELWERQKGICPYTGWEIDLPKTSQYVKTKRNYRKASLDRIDSSKGYTIDNVQFVSYMANCAKNVFTDKELIDFCESVVRFRKEILP